MVADGAGSTPVNSNGSLDFWYRQLEEKSIETSEAKAKFDNAKFKWNKTWDLMGISWKSLLSVRNLFHTTNNNKEAILAEQAAIMREMDAQIKRAEIEEEDARKNNRKPNITVSQVKSYYGGLLRANNSKLNAFNPTFKRDEMSLADAERAYLNDKGSNNMAAYDSSFYGRMYVNASYSELNAERNLAIAKHLDIHNA